MAQTENLSCFPDQPHIDLAVALCDACFVRLMIVAMSFVSCADTIMNFYRFLNFILVAIFEICCIGVGCLYSSGGLAEQKVSLEFLAG